MPQLERWDNLPEGVRQHLIERMRDRETQRLGSESTSPLGRDAARNARGRLVQRFRLLQSMRQRLVPENVPTPGASRQGRSPLIVALGNASASPQLDTMRPPIVAHPHRLSPAHRKHKGTRPYRAELPVGLSIPSAVPAKMPARGGGLPAPQCATAPLKGLRLPWHTCGANAIAAHPRTTPSVVPVVGRAAEWLCNAQIPRLAWLAGKKKD